MDRSREDPVAHDLPRAAPGALGDDSFSRSLERWAAEAVVDEAARTRIRAHWMRIQAEESAGLSGALVDLAERRTTVVIDVADHRVRGVVVGVGGDFIALRTTDDSGRDVLVRLSAIATVRAEPGAVDVRGDRSDGAALLDLDLDAVVGPVAADRPDVVVRTSHGQVVRGELRSAGTDVLRIRVDGDPPTPVWVPLGTVTMLVIGA